MPLTRGHFRHLGSGTSVRARAWLVTGPLGRGLAFAIDFAVALRTMLAQRRS
ncbi:MAG: hypothetical protein ACM3N0_02445 [Chloroflexota bacterium]